MAAMRFYGALKALLPRLEVGGSTFNLRVLLQHLGGCEDLWGMGFG